MMASLGVSGLNFLDDLAGTLQDVPASAERGSASGSSDGSGHAGYAATDGLDLSGLASLGRSLASLSVASSHDAGSDPSSHALAAGFSLGTAPSFLSEIRSTDAHTFDAAVLKSGAADADPGRSALPDVSHAGVTSAFSGAGLSDFHAFGRSAIPVGAASASTSALSDVHAFGRSAIPAGAGVSSSGQTAADAAAIKAAASGGSSDWSGKTAFAASDASTAWGLSDFDAKALSNLGAADTFHFASDLGKVPIWSGPQGEVHYDLSGHVIFDDLFGHDHVALADFGPAFDGLHKDPLKEVAHASLHGDDFHTV